MKTPELAVRSRWSALVLLCAAAWAGNPPPVADWLNQPPAVQVVVFFDASLAYQATVAYDRRVPREQILQELTVLATELGYGSLADLKRSKPGSSEKLPLAFEDGKQGSQVSFRLSERALNRSVGTFKLEPFINAFKGYRRVDLDLLVGALQGQAFAYRGLRDYDDAKVVVKYHGGASHSFRIGVKDPGYSTLKLPPFAPPTEPLRQVATSREESQRRWQIPLAVVVAIVVGWLTFVVVLRMFKPPRRRR